MPCRKTRGLTYEDINIDYKPVHKTKELEKLVVEICDTLQQTIDSFYCFYCLWSYFQKKNPKKPVSIRLFQFLKVGCFKSNP